MFGHFTDKCNMIPFFHLQVITKTDYSTAKRPLDLGILVPQDMVAISARILQPPTVPLYTSISLHHPLST